MPGERDSNNRLNRFEKRRKNTTALTWLIVLGGIFIIVLIGFMIFGGGNNDQSQGQESNTANTGEENNSNSNSTSKDNTTGNSGTTSEDEVKENQNDNTEKDEGKSSQADDPENQEIEEIEVPDDDNVLRAYRGNWEPVETEQEGPHKVTENTFDNSSQDWEEIMQAVSIATGLNQEKMVKHWVGNGGNESVIATVSNDAKTENYRVHVSWVENQGWQPTKVEVLKDVDVNN